MKIMFDPDRKDEYVEASHFAIEAGWDVLDVEDPDLAQQYLGAMWLSGLLEEAKSVMDGGPRHERLLTASEAMQLMDQILSEKEEEPHLCNLPPLTLENINRYRYAAVHCCECDSWYRLDAFNQPHSWYGVSKRQARWSSWLGGGEVVHRGV